MNIITLGINHKSASLDIREKFHFNNNEIKTLYFMLKQYETINDAFLLSTCNRTELYINLDREVDINFLLSILFFIKNIDFSIQYKKYFYIYRDKDAIRHLFKVASSLDSLILGETQIFGQLKRFIDLARKEDILNTTFNILTNMAIRLSKKVNNETNINFGSTSIGWASVLYAKKQLKTLEDKSALIIGAGKISKIAVQNLLNEKIKNIYIANRTKLNAIKLAERVGGKVIDFNQIDAYFKKIDFCICSTSSPNYIINFIINNIFDLKRLLLIDLSVPRNINPQLANFHGINLISIDDLKDVIEINQKKREEAIPFVEEIIEEKINTFYKKINKCLVN